MYFIDYSSVIKTAQMEVFMKDLSKAFILPVVIAGVGGYATNTYNQPKPKVNYANAVYAYLRKFNQAISTNNKSLLKYSDQF